MNMTKIVSMVGVAALSMDLTLTPRAADADGGITPPPVPDKLQVSEDEEAFLVGHATGTQNYVCVPSGSGFTWSLFTPQATLFNDRLQQVTTHFFSPNPNPSDNRAVRAAWQHSRDTSTVWARVVPDGSSSDPDFVAPGAIPWLLLEVVGAQEGPTGGDTLTATTSIQRLNTSGGVAPSTDCSVSTDVGKRAFVPYTADYFFYSKPESDEDDDN